MINPVADRSAAIHTCVLPAQQFSVQDIEQRIIDFYKIDKETLYRQYRGLQGQRAFPKHVFIHCIRLFTKLTLIEIGNCIGIHHTSIINSIKAVKDICSVDETIRNQVIEIESLFE